MKSQFRQRDEVWRQIDRCVILITETTVFHHTDSALSMIFRMYIYKMDLVGSLLKLPRLLLTKFLYRMFGWNRQAVAKL